jgi:hypothetical protein
MRRLGTREVSWFSRGTRSGSLACAPRLRLRCSLEHCASLIEWGMPPIPHAPRSGPFANRRRGRHQKNALSKNTDRPAHATSPLVGQQERMRPCSVAGVIFDDAARRENARCGHCDARERKANLKRSKSQRAADGHATPRPLGRFDVDGFEAERLA